MKKATVVIENHENFHDEGGLDPVCPERFKPDPVNIIPETKP